MTFVGQMNIRHVLSRIIITVDVLKKWILHFRHMLRPILAVRYNKHRPGSRKRSDHGIAREMISAVVNWQSAFTRAAPEKIARDHHDGHAHRNSRIKRRKNKILRPTT